MIADDHSTRIRAAINSSDSRESLWAHIVGPMEARTAAEVGVYRGRFTQSLLRGVPRLTRYYMIDPWQHLDDWNKPYNTDDETFDQIYADALSNTEFAAGRRVVLRGRSSEMLASIPDDTLDFAYVDGDHTLRGITIDLIQLWPKMRDGALIGGDDFRSQTRFREGGGRYEPTLVFPWIIHFAEAMKTQAFGLPFNQFAIGVDKAATRAFQFHDLDGSYGSTELRQGLLSGPGSDY